MRELPSIASLPGYDPSIAGLCADKGFLTNHWFTVLQMRMSESPDPVLIEDAINGDEPAFAELVRRYQAAVWRTVHRTLGSYSEGEDAVQEIFLRAFAALPKFDRRYPFAPWILRIASNYCIDLLRRRKSRKYKLWSELSDVEEGMALRTSSTQPDSSNPASEDPAAYLEIARALLLQLSPRRRMAFILREIEGHSYETAAKILGVPQATVRVRVWRARADLNRGFRKHQAKLNQGSKI